MKHHKTQRSLGRVRKVRVALLRSLVRSLVLHERIETTVAKARELRPHIEKLVTLAKKDTLASRRLIAARLGNDTEIAKKLHEVLAPRFKDRDGGYTRITKVGAYADVSRDKAIIEFVA